MKHWFVRTCARFTHRADAGKQLAAELATLGLENPVVVAIPRGGLQVAEPIAARLRAPLLVSLARKLPVPEAPELAFGAMDDDGRVILEDAIVREVGLDEATIVAVCGRVWDEIKRRHAYYGPELLASEVRDRTVVLVDDGLATGLTMHAAVAHARRSGARTVVVAAPCASNDAARRFEALADRFVALVVDPEFMAVGTYYDDFAQVSDREVLAILESARASHTS